MGKSQGRDIRDAVSNLEMLRRAAQAVIGVLLEPAVIDVLLDQAVAALGARAAVVRLLSPDGDELLQAGTRGLGDTYLAKSASCVTESGVNQRILAGEVVIIPDVTRDTSLQYREAVTTEGLKGMFATPARVLVKIIGE